jgi:hypothetical protein
MKLFISTFLFIYSLCSEFSSEANGKHAIFISEAQMKKHHKQTPPLAPQVTSEALNNLVSEDLHKNANTQSHAMSSGNKNKNVDGKLFSGWVKYFKYDDAASSPNNTPKKFIDNNFYIEQTKIFPNIDINEKDTDGKANYIRDKNYFWMNVFATNLNIISSKNVNFFINRMILIELMMLFLLVQYRLHMRIVIEEVLLILVILMKGTVLRLRLNCLPLHG